MTRFVFVLKADEVTIQERNNIKKAYRKENIEVQCYYQSIELFNSDIETDKNSETLICISFQYRHFVKTLQWIERIRGNGFNGIILLSTDALTFDISCAPKFIAAGGSFIIERNDWKCNPLLLVANRHAEYIDNWMYNRKNHHDIELVNEEALTALFDKILEREKFPLKDVVYLYDSLNQHYRKDLVEVLKKRIRLSGRSLFQSPKIDFSGEGLITVWDNPEFCCEFGSFIAEHTEKKVLLIDLDRLNPTFDFYRPAKGRKDKVLNRNLEGIQQLYHREQGHGEEYDRLCRIVPSKGQLKVLYGCNNLKKFEYYTNEALTEALAYYKRRYDLVIVNVNDFIYDAYTCLAAIQSDLLLVPLKSSITDIRHAQRTLEFLYSKQDLSKDKVHYIFYDCKENFANEMTLLTEILNGSLVGWIGHCNKRNNYRNLKESYCTAMTKTILKDYKELMLTLNL